MSSFIELVRRFGNRWRSTSATPAVSPSPAAAPAGLTCQELVELVTAYLDGGLSAADRARFDGHLAICDGCTAYVEQMRQTIAMAGELRETDIEPEVRETLLGAFRDWKAGRPGR